VFSTESRNVLASQQVDRDEVMLEAVGITKTYPSPSGPLTVLRDLDLRVTRGTILAIVGVSGVGKSTLLNILGTLDRADSGRLAVRGVPIQDMGERALAQLRARRLGFVFQFHHLLPEFTAEENVMMPLLIAGESHASARARAREALAAVQLRDRGLHKPSELSGGEAQRVAVARALAPEPDLILADEPSGNLDVVSADHLHALLKSLAHDQHRTLVVVTHNDRLARVADRVMTLQDGRLAPSAE
jgi:lipoprotein-releasing system ATP-binding protein